MAIVLYADTINDVIVLGIVIWRISIFFIAHEGIEGALRRAILIGQRDVEVVDGIATTYGQTMGVFPVGEVGS